MGNVLTAVAFTVVHVHFKINVSAHILEKQIYACDMNIHALLKCA